MKLSWKIILLAALLLCVPAVGLCQSAQGADTILTVVETPAQEKAERPPCFPDPTDAYIPMPETENLATGKPVSSGAHTDVYVVSNVNDGKTDTYWESKGFPAELTVDLQGVYDIAAVTVCLNPSAIWEARTQELAVLVSADGAVYTPIAEKAKYDFDPATGNRIRLDLPTAKAAYVRFVFTMNSSSRTGGAQAAEVGVYGAP